MAHVVDDLFIKNYFGSEILACAFIIVEETDVN